MSGPSKQREQDARAATGNARDWGRDYFREHPNAMLIEVARYAAKALAEKQHQIAFIQGYSQARAISDAYKQGIKRDLRRDFGRR